MPTCFNRLHLKQLERTYSLAKKQYRVIYMQWFILGIPVNLAKSIMKFAKHNLKYLTSIHGFFFSVSNYYKQQYSQASRPFDQANKIDFSWIYLVLFSNFLPYKLGKMSSDQKSKVAL